MLQRYLGIFAVFGLLILSSIGCSTAPANPCDLFLKGGQPTGNKECPAGTKCELGKCVAACKADEASCGGACVNLKKTSAHCGACGTKCEEGKSCQDGACKPDCKDAKVACGDLCVDNKTDAAHCGACDKACGTGEVCDAGTCTIKCEAEQTKCGDTCSNLNEDKKNCGACDNACRDTEVCDKGKCAPDCKSGTTNCGGACVDLKTSKTHCGQCRTTCWADENCVDSKCKPICEQGLNKCGDTCENLNTSNQHCGACEKACATGEKCSKGQCQVDCQSGLTECSGKCIDLQTDNRSCGTCTTVCKAGDVCSQGKCDIFCQQGLSKCNNTCVNTTNDRLHCGSCGNVCQSGFVCNAGVCEISCPSSQTKCGNLCVETSKDRANCGACSTACKSGEVCSNGTCEINCPTKQTECGGACTDLQSDSNNCGKCGIRCSGGKTCVAGQCACPSSLQDCKGVCQDVTNDRANCGTCENACGSGQLCSNSKCALSCPTGQTSCNNKCVDLNADISNCGACGTQCTGGKTCSSGSCSCPGTLQDCNGVCKDLTNDRANCGKCATACKSGELCSNSKCAISCPTGQTNCNNKCVDVNSDAANCGTCGTQCTGGNTCQAGSCKCPGSLSACSGVCKDLTGDRANCGTCGTVCKSGQLCVNSQCVFSCPTGQISCNGKCVDTKVDIENCGACGTKCTGGNTCQSGLCKCPGVLSACSGVCKDLTADRANCGACGKTCGSGQLCVNSACILTCPTGQIECSGKCVDTKTDSQHCGACSKKCTGGNICLASTCQCATGFTSCSGSCRDLTNDQLHCGSCGLACGAGELCISSKCVLTCPPGQIKCNGICTDTKTNRNHCGACGKACSTGEICNEGTCTLQCPTGQTICSGVCVNTNNDGKNCGSCGKTCSAGEACSSGSCVLSCPSGFQNCSGSCVNTSNDEKNCGRCAKACGAAELCLSGVCKLYCQTGWTECSGTCKDLQNDNSNCGVCGKQCPADTRCSAGQCVQACPSTQLSCGGNCVDPQTDLNHCGRCSNPCASDQACIGGKCQTCNDCPIWVKSAGSKSQDYGQSVAADNRGNTYSTGRFYTTANFDLITLTSKGVDDVYVAKQDVAGKFLWAIRFGGSASDYGYGITADTDGNSYVTGHFQNVADFGSFTLTSKGSYDVFVAKIDKTGNVLWAVRAGNTSGRADYAYGIDKDSKRNLYVVGQAYSGAIFGSLTFTARGNQDMFVAKLSNDGKFLWVKNGGGTSTDVGYDIKVDKNDFIHTVGINYNTFTFGTTTLSHRGSSDIFVAKMDSSGKYIWAQQAGGKGSEFGYRITTDASSNVYIVGYYNTETIMGTHTFTSRGSNDFFVAKLDSSGTHQWAQTGGGLAADYAYGVAVDKAGNVYVGGHFDATIFMDAVTLFTRYHADMFLAKLDKNGRYIGALQAGGNSHDFLFDLEIDSTDVLYATGYFNTSATFGKTSVGSAGSYDAWTARYGRVSCPLHHKLCNGVCVYTVIDEGNCGACGTACPSTQVCWSSACGVCQSCPTGTVTTTSYLNNKEDSFLDSADNLYVTGSFSGRVTFGTTTITSAASSVDVFVVKLDKTGKMLWYFVSRGIGYEQPKRMHVDSSGNVYVTGNSYRGNAIFGTTTLVAPSTFQEMFAFKLDKDGKFVWATRAGGIGYDYGEDIVSDNAGNAYVTGYYQSNTNGATFGSFTFTGHSQRMFVAKINPAGKYVWVKNGDYNSTQGFGIDIDSSNNLYVGGYFSSRIIFGSTTLTSKGSWDLFVAKLDSNGNPMWAKGYGGADPQYLTKLRLDKNKNIYLVGYFTKSSVFGTTTYLSKGNQDAFVVKLSPTGVHQWAVTGGGTAQDIAYNVNVDNAGNVYFVGNFFNNAVFGTKQLISYGYYDIFVVKVSSTGTVLGAISGGAGTTSADIARSIWFDSNGNLVVSGYFRGRMRMGETILSNGYYDLAIKFKF